MASKSIGAGPAVVTSSFQDSIWVRQSAAISPDVLSLEISGLAQWLILLTKQRVRAVYLTAFKKGQWFHNATIKRRQPTDFESMKNCIILFPITHLSENTRYIYPH